MKTNWNLIYVHGFLYRKGQDLSMLFPSFRDKTVRVDKISAINQIAGIYIRECCVVQNVENKCNQFVPDLVPEIGNTGKFWGNHSAPHDNIRFKTAYWNEEFIVIRRIVFQVRILEQYIDTFCFF